jgi:uroporphyrinogen decarboxylase
MTSKEERLQAAIHGEVADRPPIALWRHFPVDDQDSESLARATLAFQKEFDFDFIKVSPASSFCIRDWGARDSWEGNPEGTRMYTHRVIKEAKDWRSLTVLQPSKGSLGIQLACLSLLEEECYGVVPYLQTIFSPLAQAKNLAGEERMFVHLRQSPEDLLAGLEVITESTIRFIEAAKGRGIAGIFYAVQHGSYRFFDRETYARYGEVFDRRVLDAANDLWLNVLHLHGEDLIFELAVNYGTQIVNWHDRDTFPGLAEGKSMLQSAVCGGLRREETLVLGRPEDVFREAYDTFSALDSGRGMVLGTGCVVPIVAPYGNLKAAREAVEAGN